MDEDPSISDEQLVLCVQAGDPQSVPAFEQLVTRHSPSLARTLRRKGFASSEANDLQQEVWLRAWQGIRRYEDRGGQFVAWIYGIAKNVVRERMRELTRIDTTEVDDLDELQGSDDFAAQLVNELDSEAAMARVMALAQLAPHDYGKLIEALLADLTPAETMELYGWSRSKTDQVKLRSIRWLRDHWQVEMVGSSNTPRTES